jgi:hypothetical protein
MVMSRTVNAFFVNPSRFVVKKDESFAEREWNFFQFCGSF